MSYALSDDDSTDSDSGIRFKTESTRNKASISSLHKRRSPVQEYERKYDRNHYDIDRYSNRSDRRHRDSSRNRGYSRDSCRRSGSKESRRHRTEHKIRSSDKDCTKSSDDYRNKDKPSGRRSRNKSEEMKSDDINHENNLKRTSIYQNEVREIKRRHIRRQDSQETHSNNSDNKKVSNSTKKQKENEKEQFKDSSDTLDSQNTQRSGPALLHHLKKVENIVSSSTDLFDSTLPSKSSKNITNVEDSSSESLDVESDSCDPALSTELTKNITIVDSDGECTSSSEDSIIGPTISIDPKKKFESSKRETNDKPKENDDNSSLFGPALPPHLQNAVQIFENENENSENEKVIGPTLPPHLREILQNAELPAISTAQSHLSDSDDDMIGPVPEGHATKNLSHTLLEERALQMRLDRLGPSGPEVTVREEWMLELPKVHSVNLGLGPRQFRAKAGPDMSDRSSWTDTPQDKTKKNTKEVAPKIDIKREAELEQIRRRDVEQAIIVENEKKKKKRYKALIDLHQDKLKKKKKKEDEAGKNERRPFDRDVDLKVNRFDDAQKKSILKKAQLLDTRFSSGESKFL